MSPNLQLCIVQRLRNYFSLRPHLSPLDGKAGDVLIQNITAELSGKNNGAHLTCIQDTTADCNSSTASKERNSLGTREDCPYSLSYDVNGSSDNEIMSVRRSRRERTHRILPNISLPNFKRRPLHRKRIAPATEAAAIECSVDSSSEDETSSSKRGGPQKCPPAHISGTLPRGHKATFYLSGGEVADIKRELTETAVRDSSRSSLSLNSLAGPKEALFCAYSFGALKTKILSEGLAVVPWFSSGPLLRRAVDELLTHLSDSFSSESSGSSTIQSGADGDHWQPISNSGSASKHRSSRHTRWQTLTWWICDELEENYPGLFKYKMAIEVAVAYMLEMIGLVPTWEANDGDHEYEMTMSGVKGLLTAFGCPQQDMHYEYEYLGSSTPMEGNASPSFFVLLSGREEFPLN